MAEKIENPRVVNLMSWIRALLPIIIAALGWYIGQTVNGLERRLNDIDISNQELRVDFVETRAIGEARYLDIQRRLTSHELTLSEMVKLTEFMSRTNGLDRRLDRVENRIDKHTENGNGTKE
jgi:hypothetical protein